MASYIAVKLYGPGHVVAYNYIANFHDGIDVETYGNPGRLARASTGPTYPPREFWDRRPVAIDFYNNYLTNFHDNAIEIDGSMHNIRVMRNMMLNSASHPMCNQPAAGGPVYWIRNIVYHAPGGSTRMTSGVGGRALLQQHDPDRDGRRVVGERALAQQPDARRELRAGDLQRHHQHQLQFVGLQRLPSESRRARTRSSGTRRLEAWLAGRDTARCGAGRGRGAGAAEAGCCSPSGSRRWQIRGGDRQDQHSVLVDYDVFVNVPKLDAI